MDLLAQYTTQVDENVGTNVGNNAQFIFHPDITKLNPPPGLPTWSTLSIVSS